MSRIDVKRSFLIAVIDVAVGDCSHSGHYPRSAERDRPAVRGSGAKSPLAVAAGVNQRLAVGVGRWLVDIPDIGPRPAVATVRYEDR
jgi:hypothetical protein